MNLCGIKLIRRRNRAEKRRLHYEFETTNILIRRAQLNLENLLNEEGSIVELQYMRAVRGVLKKTEKEQTALIQQQRQILKNSPERGGVVLLPPHTAQRVFPTPKEAPELAHLWTMRAKAMYVLKQCCTFEVTRLARNRFRVASPPLYQCFRCGSVFVLRCEVYLHKHQMVRCQIRGGKVLADIAAQKTPGKPRTMTSSEGKGEKEGGVGIKNKNVNSDTVEDEEEYAQPDYLCWKLALPIVDAALQPLGVYLSPIQEEGGEGDAQGVGGGNEKENEMSESKKLGSEDENVERPSQQRDDLSEKEEDAFDTEDYSER